jgi:hypothetical protein
MEQDGRNNRNPGHKLETAMNPDNQAGRNTGIYSTLDAGNRDTDGLVSEPSVFDNSQRRTAANHAVRNVDGEGSVQALSMGNHGHSHVATPTSFNGKKEDFCGFRRELGLYLMASHKDFKEDKSMVIFALSYMKIGPATKWADAFMDKALENDDWGSYANFLDQLTKDFLDKDEPRKALEEMGQLYQGKGTVSDYFQKMEQLTSIAGIDINRMPHVLLQMEKGLNAVLIDQLYFSGNHPENYHDYKKRIIDADDMRRRCEANRRKPTQATPRQKNVNDMDVDKTKNVNKTRKCYGCNKTRHLAWNCPNKETRQDF